MALLLGLTVAGCGSDDTPEAATTPTPAPSSLAPTTAAPVGKPGCTALSALSLTYFGSSKNAAVSTLTATEGWVVPGPANDPPAFTFAVRFDAAGQPPAQVAAFVGFAEQPGERDEVLVYAVDAPAKAITNLTDISKASNVRVAAGDPTIAAAKACFGP